MTELEAIQARHSVRKYTEAPIEEAKVAIINNEIGKINALTGSHVQLVLDEPKAFSSGVLKYGQFSGVRNYLVMAAHKGKEAEENIGYHGERLVLLAQTLGLNTCWVGLTYKKIPGAFSLAEGEVVHCVIALGHGVNQGVAHTLKPIEKFYEADRAVPDWFKAGIEAAILAPTAVNQQKFKFILKDGDKVEAKTTFSVAGYTNIDLGIVKCHFELGAGKDNFKWA
ncbi:MAG: nitroreductase [Bacteroidales bacterium]|nr:nitroreductase [Bacteroidales bacterium]